ncbi:MAG: DivIVA domain-containing protein, partial [Aeromicrobium sp.]
MPLTPEDVRNKRFTPVRLREGYDMGEVDQFLDEVEAELERLTVENDELRAKVAAASTGEPTGLIPALSSSTPAAQTPPTPAVQEPVEVKKPEPEPEPEPVPAPVVAPAPVRATPSMGDASSAA